MYDPLPVDEYVSAWIRAGKPVREGQSFENLPPYQSSGSTFHVSELGKCLRQTVLRLSGSPKKPNTDAEEAMYDLANYIHWRACRSLEHAGILVAEEFTLNQWLRPRWGGRFDVLARVAPAMVRVEDFKSVHPNWVNANKQLIFQLPKEKDVKQASVYYHALIDMGVNEWGTIVPEVAIDYLDRGGSNPSQPRVAAPISKPILDAGMVVVEQAWENYETLGVLPGMLPTKVFWGARYYTKREPIVQTGGKLKWGAGWECRYCKYPACPQERESYEVGSLTKTKGLILNDFARQRGLESEIMDFVERFEAGEEGEDDD